jgi:hypothetical protein
MGRIRAAAVIKRTLARRATIGILKARETGLTELDWLWPLIFCAVCY